jgi:hypothetical protein
MESIADLVDKQELLKEPVTDAKLELARQLYISLESQILLADRKVQAVFGLNAFLVAALSLQNQQSLAAILKVGLSLNIVLDLLLKGSFLSCVSIATWSAVKALSPRVSRSKKNPVGQKRSLFFFNDIRAQTMKEFSSAFLDLTNEEALTELLASAYSISGILQTKYRMLKRSVFFISVALFVWILLQINKFLA